MTYEHMTLEQRLDVLRELLRTDVTGSLWDVVTCLRGPDTPSERPSMPPAKFSEAYAARRARKYKTVEVIRERALKGLRLGSRLHKDDKVIVSKDDRDHFDNHVLRAACALSLRVEYE